MHSRHVLNNSQGLTLIELMIVLLIILVLAAVALPAYNHFTKKAKMVEGEMALHTIEKLESAYFTDLSSYSDNLALIGFTPVPPLKYYTVAVILGDNNPISYQATATANSPDLGSFLLIKYADGRAEYLQVSTAGSGTGGSGAGGSGDGGDAGGGSGGGAGGGDTGSGKEKKEKKEKKDK